MAGAPKKPPTKLVRMRVSPLLYSYLGTLAGTTLLGTVENDVAENLLTSLLKAMREDNYHVKNKVPPD